MACFGHALRGLVRKPESRSRETSTTGGRPANVSERENLASARHAGCSAASHMKPIDYTDLGSVTGGNFGNIAMQFLSAFAANFGGGLGSLFSNGMGGNSYGSMYGGYGYGQYPYSQQLAGYGSQYGYGQNAGYDPRAQMQMQMDG